jgi:hypothetical protein
MIPADTIAEYQPGGDIYAQLASLYGADAANQIAAAATTGDRTQLSNVLETIKGYPAASDASTAEIFINQLITDPLAAPLASANNLIGNSVTDFFKNPWVLAATGAIIFFFVLDGTAKIKQILK